jgi:hypothetical protein
MLRFQRADEIGCVQGGMAVDYTLKISDDLEMANI